MIEDAILELTKLLIKQDLKDRENGTEIISMAKKDFIRENIQLLKLIKSIY